MEITVLDVSSFVDSFGSEVERLAMDIAGNDVQVLRFDGDNRGMYVFFNQHAEVMPLESINGYIAGMVGYV